jgi:hypothetical protein
VIFEICDDVVLQISAVLQTSLTPVEKEQATKKITPKIWLHYALIWRQNIILICLELTDILKRSIWHTNEFI